MATLQSSTLSAALTAPLVAVGQTVGTQYVRVAASPTGLAIPYVAFVDNEAMTVTADNGSGLLSVNRGDLGTATHNHKSGATVYFGTPDQFGSGVPSSAVSDSTGLANTPYINMGVADEPPYFITNPAGAGNQINYYYPWKCEAIQTAVTPVTTGNYTALVTDCLIEYSALAGASTVTLPPASSVPVGKVFIVKDATGNAGTNNITVSPNIEGAALKVSSNYGVQRIYRNNAGAYSTF